MDKMILAQKREGKMISDTPEWIYTSVIGRTEPEKIGRDVKTVLYTTHGEYIVCTNTDHIMAGLAQLDGYFITDRSRVANLNLEADVDKQRGLLVFKNACIGIATIAKSRLEDILRYIGNKR